MSKLFDAALDPSCLMCLTPGGWWSPIRPGVVWPGNPRNFAAEQATWSDFVVLVKATAAVFDFEMQVNINAYKSQMIFGNEATGVSCFEIKQNSDGKFTFFVPTLANRKIWGTAGSVGVHTFKITDDGITTAIYIDGVLMYGYTGALRPNPADLTQLSAVRSDFDGDMPTARMTSNGALIWSYPSYAERLRLGTYSNVRIDGRVFRAANPSLGWSIKTALPAGLTGTVLAKINGVVVTNPAQWNRTTATFTGLAADTLEWLMVRTDTMAAGQIAYLSN